jgi:hypothetical protein
MRGRRYICIYKYVHKHTHTHTHTHIEHTLIMRGRRLVLVAAHTRSTRLPHTLRISLGKLDFR